MDEALRADLLVNWAGAGGTVAYLAFLAQNRTRSALETRALFLVRTLAVMLLIRGFSWAMPGRPFLDTLELVPSTLLPMALVIFVEGLLRRHLPMGVKVFALVSTSVFAVVNLWGRLATHPVLARAFPVALVVVLALVAGFIAFRDRTSLSAAENRLCAGILAVGMLNVPLALSDFRLVFGVPPNRMGAIGVLAFCHLLARGGEVLVDARAVVRYLGLVALKAGVATLTLVVLLGPATRERLTHMLPVALALVLSFELWERLRASRARTRQRTFLRWLATDDSRDLPAFVDALARCPILDDYLVVGEAEIQRYDREALFARMRRIGHDCTLGRMRREARRVSGRSLEAAEQLVDLLERYQMTQVVLLGEEPPRLLLVNRPEFADHDALLGLRLIARRARALAQRPLPDA
jgi:hypothetical protein